MLTDGRASEYGPPPENHKPRASRRRTALVVIGIVAVVLAAGVGAMAAEHHAASASPAPKALKLQASPLVIAKARVGSVSPAAKSAKSAKAATTPTAAASPSKTSTAQTPAPVSPPSSWTLAFDPSFAGDTLDTGIWGTCYPWESSSGCTNFGNTTDAENEWYQPSQVQVSGGVLHLVAQHEATAGLTKTGATKQYACRSGMVTTYNGFHFEYGYVQIVAKVPLGNGLWSALWLAAANEQWPPEVDILEHWHYATEGKVYLHPTSGARQGGPVNMPDLSDGGYHTFSLMWTPTRLTWYYDGYEVFSTTTGVPQQSMYLIMNLANDQTLPGNCSGSFDIESVKIWQPPS